MLWLYNFNPCFEGIEIIWCRKENDENCQKLSLYPDGVWVAYTGPPGEGVFWPDNRVLRGGSWFYPDSYALRTWFRYGSPPEVSEGVFGFRCSKDAR
jgi:hypothetical protein